MTEFTPNVKMLLRNAKALSNKIENLAWEEQPDTMELRTYSETLRTITHQLGRIAGIAADDIGDIFNGDDFRCDGPVEAIENAARQIAEGSDD